MRSNKELYRARFPLRFSVTGEFSHCVADNSGLWEIQSHLIALIQTNEVMMRLLTHHRQRAKCKMVSKKNAAMYPLLSAASQVSAREEFSLEYTAPCER